MTGTAAGIASDMADVTRPGGRESSTIGIQPLECSLPDQLLLHRTDDVAIESGHAVDRFEKLRIVRSVNLEMPMKVRCDRIALWCTEMTIL